MFKHISVKKARIISAVIGVIIGILYGIITLSFNNNTAETIYLHITLAFFLPICIFAIIYTVVFSGPIRERNEKTLSYVEGFLSREEFRRVNLNVVDNEFIELAISESPISYYAKITSDTEITISIRKDGEEITSRFIEILYFRHYFTA